MQLEMQRIDQNRFRALSRAISAKSRVILFALQNPASLSTRCNKGTITATSLEGYGCPNFPTTANNGVCNEDFVNDTRDRCCKPELGIICGGLRYSLKSQPRKYFKSYVVYEMFSYHLLYFESCVHRNTYIYK